jgi:inosine/guanosine/xanthosine phosphorylase family protein
VTSRETADRAAAIIKDRTLIDPEVGVILATGLAPCADVLENTATVPFTDLPGFRPSRVPSHVNEVTIGAVEGRGVAVMKAKILPCDGATWEESGIPARTLARLGCRVLIYIANSGSMRPDLLPGGFMAFTDHVNFSGFNPLAQEREGGGWQTPFLSMSDLYDAAQTEAVCEAVEAAGVALPKGIAGYWMGPSFETPAEIRLAQLAGCSISSNSFLPEVMAAHHAGMRVVALTFISTMSAGIEAPLVLSRILEVTGDAHNECRTILRAAIPVC